MKLLSQPNKRIVITGIGTVNPLGNNVNETYINLINGVSGVISLENESYHKSLPKNYSIGSPIRKSFQKEQYKTVGTDNLVNEISISSAIEAVKDSGLYENLMKQEINPHRIGVITGTSSSSLNCIVNSARKAYEKKDDYNNIDRMGMLKLLSNLINFNLSSFFKIKGKTSALSLSCASGLNCLGEGMKSIQNNDCDIVICGSSEASLGPFLIHSMNKLGTLCKDQLTSKSYLPREASRPFDINRSGIVIGEGSAMFVLEEYEKARQRKAKIYGEIKGYFTNGDSYHLTKPIDNGEGAFVTMSHALLQSEMELDEIDMINCHATSTLVGDVSEVNAIKTLFGHRKLESKQRLFEYINEYYYSKFRLFSEEYDRISKENLEFSMINLSKLGIMANKTQVGHLLGASGSVEVMIALKCMENNIILDNYNTLSSLDMDNSLNFRNNENGFYSNRRIRSFIKNSFAFGGVNSSILIKKVENL